MTKVKYINYEGKEIEGIILADGGNTILLYQFPNFQESKCGCLIVAKLKRNKLDSRNLPYINLDELEFEEFQINVSGLNYFPSETKTTDPQEIYEQYLNSGDKTLTTILHEMANEIAELRNRN